MEDIIKQGYQLFIKRQENGELIGSFTLKDEKNYKDIDAAEKDQMQFLTKYPMITETLDSSHSLSIIYLTESCEFLVSIQEQFLIGEYQDQIIWEDQLVNQNENLDEALNQLNEQIKKNKKELVI